MSHLEFDHQVDTADTITVADTVDKSVLSMGIMNTFVVDFKNSNLRIRQEDIMLSEASTPEKPMAMINQMVLSIS